MECKVPYCNYKKGVMQKGEYSNSVKQTLGTDDNPNGNCGTPRFLGELEKQCMHCVDNGSGQLLLPVWAVGTIT